MGSKKSWSCNRAFRFQGWKENEKLCRGLRVIRTHVISLIGSLDEEEIHQLGEKGNHYGILRKGLSKTTDQYELRELEVLAPSKMLLLLMPIKTVRAVCSSHRIDAVSG